MTAPSSSWLEEQTRRKCCRCYRICADVSWRVQRDKEVAEKRDFSKLPQAQVAFTSGATATSSTWSSSSTTAVVANGGGCCSHRANKGGANSAAGGGASSNVVDATTRAASELSSTPSSSCSTLVARPSMHYFGQVLYPSAVEKIRNPHGRENCPHGPVCVQCIKELGRQTLPCCPLCLGFVHAWASLEKGLLLPRLPPDIADQIAGATSTSEQAAAGKDDRSIAAKAGAHDAGNDGEGNLTASLRDRSSTRTSCTRSTSSDETTKSSKTTSNNDKEDSKANTFYFVLAKTATERLQISHSKLQLRYQLAFQPAEDIRWPAPIDESTVQKVKGARSYCGVPVLVISAQKACSSGAT
ncbi:unnamed protein product [Amoebophrya sp. A25]|nr:unnamed protein product [Amoebophrya sp. A25]|eukprot:GSA25T00007374001.1